MDLFEAIEKRRTVRTFKKKPSEEQLKKIILAGSKAPSSRNSQPWEFILVEDQKIIDQLAEQKYLLSRKMPPAEGEGQDKVEERALSQKKSFENASVIAVCHPKGQVPSAWLCIENVSLGAVGEGLGTGIVVYWGEEEGNVKKILGLPEGFDLAAVLKVGEPGEKPGAPPKRKDFSWLHKNRF